MNLFSWPQTHHGSRQAKNVNIRYFFGNYFSKTVSSLNSHSFFLIKGLKPYRPHTDSVGKHCGCESVWFPLVIVGEKMPPIIRLCSDNRLLVGHSALTKTTLSPLIAIRRGLSVSAYELWFPPWPENRYLYPSDHWRTPCGSPYIHPPPFPSSHTIRRAVWTYKRWWICLSRYTRRDFDLLMYTKNKWGENHKHDVQTQRKGSSMKNFWNMHNGKLFFSDKIVHWSANKSMHTKVYSCQEWPVIHIRQLCTQAC